MSEQRAHRRQRVPQLGEGALALDVQALRLVQLDLLETQLLAGQRLRQRGRSTEAICAILG